MYVSFVLSMYFMRSASTRRAKVFLFVSDNILRIVYGYGVFLRLVDCYGYTAVNVLIKRAAANVGYFLCSSASFFCGCVIMSSKYIVIFDNTTSAKRLEVDFRGRLTRLAGCVAGEDFERDCCRVACRAALAPCAAVPCAGGAGSDYVYLCEFLFVVFCCYEFKPRNTIAALCPHVKTITSPAAPPSSSTPAGVEDLSGSYTCLIIIYVTIGAYFLVVGRVALYAY